MTTDSCITFKRESLISEDLQDFISDTPIPFSSDIMMGCVKVPIEIALQDPSLRKIYSQYKFTPYIFKMDPQSCYTWHVDTIRGVTINQLIRHTSSKCFFGVPKYEYLMDVEEYVYPENHMVMFNTQKHHTIFNMMGERYLFTVNFIDKKDKLTFSQLKKYCVDTGLI